MASEDDRLFVRDGWRHYRRRYSVAEVRWGLACLAAMVVIGGWVVWMGQNPDPELFADGASLLEVAGPGPTKVPIETALPVSAKTGTASGEGGEGTAEGGGEAVEGASSTERGPLPAGLAGTGWKEEKVAQFDEENLYIKINGRADYFRAFAFKRLYSAVLVNAADPATSIDIEMYDLSNAPNALGAYGGERPPGAKVQITADGLHHFDRNALYLARGPFYIRVIGSDETPIVTEKLQELAKALVAGVGGEPLPWAYGVFIGAMDIGAEKVTYFAKNAFSLAFATDMWTARPEGKDSDLELFIAAKPTPAAAAAFARELEKAFLELGEPGGKMGKLALAKDPFLGLYSAAGTAGRFVVGVRGAASAEAVQEQVKRLQKGIGDTAPDVLAQARAAAVDGASAGANEEGVDER